MSEGEKSQESEPEAPLPKVVTDAWSLKVPDFKKGDMRHPLADETSFKVLYPKYREKYLESCWPLMKKKMEVRVFPSRFFHASQYIYVIMRIQIYSLI